jgi:uncharacterized linocin/CFP29 family protein
MITTNEVTKLGWSEEIWNRIHEAVHDECKRTKVASKFIPLYGPVSPGALTVPSDSIEPDDRQALTVDEAATTPLLELFVEFTLTPQQVEREQELMTAVTLATRAANLLSQAEDIVLFQGQSAINGENTHPLFKEKKVHVRSGPAGEGLLNSANPDRQIVKVPLLDQYEGQQRYGENTFAAVAEAYSRLQSGEGLAQAHYGPYALVLHYVPYADTLAPLPTTLIMPADRIKSLVTCSKTKEAEVEFYDTGTLPPYSGLLVSLGGNTMDLVVGVDATTKFLTEDEEGRYRFRVFERFALRLKDPSAVMRLEFEPGG